MDWFKTSDPNLVQDASGQTVPVTAIDPMLDRVLPAPTSAVPTPVSAGALPTTAASPAAPVTAASTLAKLDAVTGPLNQRQPQLPIAQTSTTTTSTVPSSVLEPVLARGTERAEKEAGAAQALGAEKARIGEQQAMTTATAAYGQQQMSEQEARDHAQRAEIARQNQLAFAAQEDPQVDPDRFIRSMSTGTSIATILLGALEGAFRGMSGQPGKSGVLDILERRVDQDIMAQKEQIASGRIRRGNMIAYFQQQGLTEEAAERAAKAMSYAQLEKLTQAEIARQGAGYARAEGDALAEAIRARREQANDELRLANVPRSQTTVVRQAPGPGAGAGDAFSKLLAARKAYEESGATPEQLATFDQANGMGAMAPAGESKFAQDKRKSEKPTEAEAKKADAISTLQGLADSLRGLPDRVYTPESASLPKRMAHAGGDLLFGEGAGERMDLTLSKEDLANSQKFTQARNSFLSLVSVLNGQGAMSDPEREAAVAAAQAANSPAQLQAAIQNALQARGADLRPPPYREVK